MAVLLCLTLLMVYLPLMSAKRLGSVGLAALDVSLPKGLHSVPAYCVKSKEILLKHIAKDSNDAAYACAFAYFQSGFADKRTPVYTAKDVDMRFGNFKSCVDEVNSINKEQNSWTAGITFFCDFTEEETGKYTNGLLVDQAGDGNLLGSSGAPGAPGALGSFPGAGGRGIQANEEALAKRKKAQAAVKEGEKLSEKYSMGLIIPDDVKQKKSQE